MTKDRGLKQAMKRLPAEQLPGNFTYRLMQQVNRAASERERQKERRLRVLMLSAIMLAGGGGLAFFCRTYGGRMAGTVRKVADALLSGDGWGFILFLLPALLILTALDFWLRKRFKHLLGHE